jgi:hypothetical protein
MKICKFFLPLLIFTISGTALLAQKKPAVKTVKYVKFKPPKLITLLSNYRDSVKINTGEAEEIISMPLRIVDDKKNVYVISSYQFLYKKNVVTEDEETGKVSATTTIFSERFRTTPLPAPWVSKVRENLKAKETLYFFDIIVKDVQGRVMYAPDLKINVF